MSSNRRNFLQKLTIGTGSLLAGLPVLARVKNDEADQLPLSSYENDQQRFNMCGYGAPKLNVVRIGIVGLGMRGSGAVERLSYIDGVEITALCDKFPDRVTSSQKTLEKMGQAKGQRIQWRKWMENFVRKQRR